MKRALSAWALALALTIPAALPASAAAFSDVAADAWYAQAVEEVTAAGLMNGVSADAFAPDAEVTRGMVVAVLWRLAGSPQAETTTSFPDVTAGDYYAEAVAWAQSAGIAAGRADGTFGGSAPVTREELAQWQPCSGIPLRKWFNTSGLSYRSLGLKDKLPGLTEEEQLELLAGDGMLVKRPILVDGQRVLIGFRAETWEEALRSE